jgi:hypothetical protein
MLGDLLVPSGSAFDGLPRISEAEIRADLARKMGILSEVILPEKTAKTMREESLRIESVSYCGHTRQHTFF